MTIYHTHHIVPRHMGGSDDPSNLVKLTVEEHAHAHLKLYEEHGKKEDLWAYQLLSNQITFDEGFAKVLTKNARDTHRKCKENKTGVYSSEHQSKAGRIGAAKSGLGKKNTGNTIRVSCLGCKKETSKPTFHAWHLKNC